MKIKDLTVKIKAGPADGLGEGQFQAYASVFGNKDSYGDVVMPGAFTDTLAEWKASGSPIPLLWGHNMADPDYNLGHVLDATQDEKGLLITAQLDPDQLSDPSSKTAQTYRLLKGKRVNQMSFAFDVLEGGEATKAADDGSDGDVYELRALKLYEVSVVPIGANQETEILAVKTVQSLADGMKEGRVLASKHIDSLRSAYEALGSVIKAAEGSTDDQEKASGTGPANDASPDGAKSEEPSRSPSAADWTAEIDIIELEGASL